jgi:hypothetical protein
MVLPRRLVVLAVAAAAVAGPVAAGASASDAPAATPLQEVSYSTEKAAAAAGEIRLDPPRPQGALAMALTWEGPPGLRYNVMKISTNGNDHRYYDAGEKTSLFVTTEANQQYCFEVEATVDRGRKLFSNKACE